MISYIAGLLRGAVGEIDVVCVSASSHGSDTHVGHDPSHSPYLDILRGGVGVITFGYLGGSRGGPGVGLSDGPTGGLRYEVAFGNAIGASLGVAYARTTRFVVDPTKDSLSRRTGPFDNDVALVDVARQPALRGGH